MTRSPPLRCPVDLAALQLPQRKAPNVHMVLVQTRGAPVVGELNLEL